MEQHKLFATMPPTRLFFRCAIPSIISMAVTSLYVIADGIFVGRFIGAEALAAINLVMPFIMISFALSDMIAVGSSVQIAIHLGQKKEKESSSIFSFSCLLIFLISSAMGLIGFFFAEPLIRLMGAEESVVIFAAQYMKVYAAFAPLIMIFFAVDNYLRICGKPRYSMILNVIMAVGNIILDWLFIVEFGWGVWSAALASCVSILAGTLLGFFPFIMKKLPLRFVHPKISKGLMKNIVANGSSEFFSNISASVYMLMVNVVLLRLAGSMSVAAFSIVMYIDSIVTSILFGMSDAIQPAISYNYGAGERKRVFALEKRAILAGAILSISVMILMMNGGTAIIPLFIDEQQPELLHMSERAMFLFALSYIVSWFGTVASSFFTAMNRPIMSLTVALGQTLVFPLIFLAVLPNLFGLDGVWLVSSGAEILTSILAGIFMWRLVREQQRLEK